MKFFGYKILNYCTIVLVLLLSSKVGADSINIEVPDPYGEIERITEELLVIIDVHQHNYPENEEQYFVALSELLDSSVDFEFISKAVMGSFYKQATAEQRGLFLEEFQQGLVETYGRGLINYGDQEILLVDRRPLKDGQKKLVVKQEIRSTGGVFPLRYSMARKKTGEWKIINMTISGINLGKTFRSQFAQAAQKSVGDLDAVIAEWVTESN